MELRLVLDSAGIMARVDFDHGRWLLSVDEVSVERAEHELDEYRRENLTRSSRVIALAPVFGGAVPGVMLYAVVVLAVGIATLPWGLAVDLFTPGQMQSGQVMSGQWWRTVTALTLHLDEGHLASNLLFGVLFGFLAGRTLGGGMAWLSIVVAGSLGNLVNAMVQSDEHTSVGASTAVFAALGILVADALRPRVSAGESLLRRWSPLVGGMMLLSFIGIGGGRVDVMAHVTGFLAGLVIGFLISRLPVRWRANDKLQFATGSLALIMVSIAWVIALRSAQ